MKKTRKRIFRSALILALLLALIGLTVSTYAYWDTLVTNQSEVITIGEGQEVVVVPVNLKPNKVLVPATVTADPATEVTSVVLTYNVDLNQPTESPLTLSVESDNVLVGGDPDSYGLVNIDITLSDTSVNQDQIILVTVTVTLTEPHDVIEYNAIKGQDITFDLIFTAA